MNKLFISVLLSNREHRRMNRVIPDLLDRLFLLLTWLIGLSLVFVFLTYSLTLFAITRPTGEVLAGSIGDLADEALSGMTAALLGRFVATLIFLMAWMVTRISTEFFIGAATRPADKPGLNALRRANSLFRDPLNKTDQEYYSRTVKKKVVALANAEMHSQTWPTSI